MPAEGSEGTPYWSIGLNELLQRLETALEGLAPEAAADRLVRAPRIRDRRLSSWLLLVRQFNSPIMVLLFCSAILSFTLVDDATNAIIILVILIASGLLSFWQERSASEAVAKLLRMVETRATVIRSGIERNILLAEVVPGDIIGLKAGDLIPGDCRLITSRDLFVNEAILTGESFPAEKAPSELPAETPLGRRGNSLFLGTHVISGLATAVVVETGTTTEFGKISARLKERSPTTGFERGLQQFGRLLIQVVLVITVAVFAIKVGWQKKPVIDSLLVGLALAVGMTPQLLPAITSVVLAAGAKAMSRRQVIVKQLLSIENLGSMTVLCSDKTGTLTEGTIHLEAALDTAGRPSERVLRLASLNAFFETGFANPIDAAIRAHATLDVSGIEKLDEIPYDFVRKRLSVRLLELGQQLLITKGALSNVLECCTQAEIAHDQLVDLAPLKTSIHERFSALSQQGLRVLGLAIRSISVEHITKADEAEMTFLGFLVFADPPKADAQQTLARLRDLGVDLKLVTGDNRIVAESLSRRVGIANPFIVTGGELRQLSDDAVQQRVVATNVFAEVEPNQKERIILALKRAGHVVGYLGDGINDASALHAADVGISVASAVDVAREAAQVVLLKHDLGVLVEGIREGRRTFANTLKYVFFAITANFGYMFSLAVASLLLPFEPLLAHQILLVNLLADFPAMALASDSVDPEQLERPRRWDIAFIVSFMMTFGFASSMFDFLTFGAILIAFGENPELFNTGWFVESTLTGLMILMIIRTRRPFFRSQPGQLFLGTTAIIAVVTLLLPYSIAAAPLGFVTPPPLLMAITLGITLIYGAGMELVKSWFYSGWN